MYNPPTTTIANLRDLTPNAVTVSEVMKKNGYTTVGFTGDAGARGVQGNNIGFDIYIDTPPGFNGFDSSVPAALDWLEQNKDKKVFMFLHGYDSHGQHNSKEFTRNSWTSTTGANSGEPSRSRPVFVKRAWQRGL